MSDIIKLDDLATTDEKIDLLQNINNLTNEKLFKVERKNTATLYTANWDFVYGALATDPESDSGKYRVLSSELGPSDVDIGFIYPSLGNTIKVELPFKPTTNNATRVENNGKILFWELEDMGVNNINFSFEFPEEALIDYNPQILELLNVTINDGDTIILKLKNTIKKEDISIVDEDKNSIPFELNNGNITFTNPNKKVTIKVKGYDNPKTVRSYFIYTLILFILGGSVFIIKRRHNH